MAKISKEDKLDNFRNMRAMIEDYKELHNRFPTIREFESKLNMSEATVKRYKNAILTEDRVKLLETFQGDIISDAKDLDRTIKENIKLFKDIRDDPECVTALRMDAAKNMEEAYIDSLRIKRDSSVLLDYDDVQSKQEHIHGEEDRVKDGLAGLFD